MAETRLQQFEHLYDHVPLPLVNVPFGEAEPLRICHRDWPDLDCPDEVEPVYDESDCLSVVVDGYKQAPTRHGDPPYRRHEGRSPPT